MSDEPIEMQGRMFYEGGKWYFVQCGGSKYMMKIMNDEYQKAVEQKTFEALHALTVAPDGSVVYLPTAMGTKDPWVMNGAQCSVIAEIHPKKATTLDADIKRSFSAIQEARKGLIIEDGSLSKFRKL